jgi:hypothetical protein
VRSLWALPLQRAPDAGVPSSARVRQLTQKGIFAMVSMTLEMEEALARICELDRGDAFVTVALEIIRMRNCASIGFKEFMLLNLIRALEEQRETVSR